MDDSLPTASTTEDTIEKPKFIPSCCIQFCKSRWFCCLLLMALTASLIANAWMSYAYDEYFSEVISPMERFHSGEVSSEDKIALIYITGSITPPFTERTLKAIERADEDESVKGVILVIDSPGGLVADSHQIYHRLKQLREKKPIYVSMKRMAASGGLYVAMGVGTEGRIFAEPTTWTGSIGVIIPRFDMSDLAEKVGFASDSIKTGEFKDSLNSFRPLSENDKKLWDAIIEDAYSRFIGVIADNRKSLTAKEVRNDLATGQIFTANQAKTNGLVDEIGFEDDVIEAMKEALDLPDCRIIQYSVSLSLTDILLNHAESKPAPNELAKMLEPTVPRAMYFCSGSAGIPRMQPKHGSAN